MHQLISDDKICASFKTLRGTPQYFHNMLLDVLEKNMSVLCLFYDILMIVAWQYGEIRTDKGAHQLDCSTKSNYLNRNL